MATKGFMGASGSKVRMSKNLLGGSMIERATAAPSNVQSLDDLTPDITGTPVVDPSTDFGTGKVVGSKGNAGIIRPTTKPKRG